MPPHRRTGHLWSILALIAALLLALYLSQRVECAPVAAAMDATQAEETPQAALERIIAERRVVNAHEHIQDSRDAARLLPVMDRHGIGTTVLVGSSRFTTMLRERVGYTGYDENNEELLRAVREHPGRFEAYPTINPQDPEKLDKLRGLHERGAVGLKLYLGHSYVRRDGEYMFHVMALDDPEMLPVYAYCEQNFIPVCFHVQPYAPGFAQQFADVLRQFPNLKVNVPHFFLSTRMDSRLREFLDTFPNLYADISFGHDEFLREGLQRISRSPARFRALFEDYPDRFLFGTDLVITPARHKTEAWMGERTQVYYDMLAREEYTTPLLPHRTLRGLALPPALLENILYKNYERFRDAQPENTEITRELNWRRTGVRPLQRAPGETFPPDRRLR